MDETEQETNKMKDDKSIEEKNITKEFAEYGDNIDDIMKFVSSCNSLSELIDKLCIENIRLWHILDDTIMLKNELEKPGLDETERVKILERIAKKSFENIETVKRRSIFKKSIDQVFMLNVKMVLDGKDPNICNENKNYGRNI